MDHPEQEHEPSTWESTPAPRVAPLAKAPWRAIVVGLAVLVLLPLLLAGIGAFGVLGFSPPSAHVIPPERLDHAPAASLRVNLAFDGALVPGPTTTVTGWVTTIQGVGVVLTGGQTLTINGAPLIHDQRSTPVTLPRQGPGGEGYTLIYTDEQGQQTVEYIPAPLADFAVLAPAPGSRVPLPHLVGPDTTSGGRNDATPTPNPATPALQLRPPNLADTPFTVRYALPYSAQSVLQGQTSTEAPNQCPNNNCTRKNLYVVRMMVFGPCAPTCPSAQTMCEVGMRNQTAPTGTATMDDRGYPLGAGFEKCGPGPGEIDLSTRLVWNLPSTSFWNVHVEFNGVVKAPITWV